MKALEIKKSDIKAGPRFPTLDWVAGAPSYPMQDLNCKNVFLHFVSVC